MEGIMILILIVMVVPALVSEYFLEDTFMPVFITSIFIVLVLMVIMKVSGVFNDCI